MIIGLPVNETVDREEKVLLVVRRWMRGTDEQLHSIVKRLELWETKDRATRVEQLAEELSGFVAALRQSADTIERAIAKPSAIGDDLWAELDKAKQTEAPS